LDTLILILQGANWIEKAQMGLVIFLTQVSYLGTTKKQACVALSTVELNTLLL